MKTNLQSMETASNKLIRFIVGARPLHDETKESFCIRRNHLIASCKVEAKVCVRQFLCWKLVTWVEHLYRKQSGVLFKLLVSQDELWLQTCRALAGNTGVGRSIFAGATQTRSSPGFPLRWGEGWLEDVGRVGGGWDNPQKSKERSQEKVNALLARIGVL